MSGIVDLAVTQSLADLGETLSSFSMMAGWNKVEPSLYPDRPSVFSPFAWSWEQARVGLDVAGELISTEAADRRNLFMVNPLENNNYATLRTLVAAYQMIRPGERARSHRHSPNALRLVLDAGDGVYTVVDGERIDMLPGDIVLTPGMAFHGHGNDGTQAGYWIDVLDVPLVHLLEPMTFEPWPGDYQPVTRTTHDSPYVFRHAQSRAELEKSSPDAYDRTRFRLVAPCIATMALHVESLRPNAPTLPLRTTANQIVAVMSGSGTTTIGGHAFGWKPGDCLAMPSWTTFSHHADEPSMLLSVSDEAALERLNFLRTEFA